MTHCVCLASAIVLSHTERRPNLDPRSRDPSLQLTRTLFIFPSLLNESYALIVLILLSVTA
jgi:hypothetical protein